MKEKKKLERKKKQIHISFFFCPNYLLFTIRGSVETGIFFMIKKRKIFIKSTTSATSAQCYNNKNIRIK